jgi:ABC-2 type transport system ATP-binding protein
VLDQGTPAELVARHAGEVTVRFGLQEMADVAARAATLQAVNRLPGVHRVTQAHEQVAVRGGREVIAHVGAWLVGTGRPVPTDLRVDIPNLESALLTLLDHPTDHTDQRIAS